MSRVTVWLHHSRYICAFHCFIPLHVFRWEDATTVVLRKQCQIVSSCLPVSKSKHFVYNMFCLSYEENTRVTCQWFIVITFFSFLMYFLSTLKHNFLQTDLYADRYASCNVCSLLLMSARFSRIPDVYFIKDFTLLKLYISFFHYRK